MSRFIAAAVVALLIFVTPTTYAADVVGVDPLFCSVDEEGLKVFVPHGGSNVATHLWAREGSDQLISRFASHLSATYGGVCPDQADLRKEVRDVLIPALGGKDVVGENEGIVSTRYETYYCKRCESGEIPHLGCWEGQLCFSDCAGPTTNCMTIIVKP